MIKGNENFSESAKKFYQLLKSNSPDLLRFVRVVSPSDNAPYTEPGSIILEIPARKNFIFEKLYVETRKEDILIALGNVLHRHISWWSENVIEKQIIYAIQFITDILNERVIFVKRKTLLAGEEYYENIHLAELGKKKRIIAIYSWNGTYGREKP